MIDKELQINLRNDFVSVAEAHAIFYQNHCNLNKNLQINVTMQKTDFSRFHMVPQIEKSPIKTSKPGHLLIASIHRSPTANWHSIISAVGTYEVTNRKSDLSVVTAFHLVIGVDSIIQAP
jgi:hypothetical protein